MLSFRNSISLVALAVLLLCGTVSAWGFTLEINPLPAVSVGQSNTVDVWARGLTTGQTIGAFDLWVDFDPAKFSYQSFLPGTGLGDPAQPLSFYFVDTSFTGAVDVLGVSFLAETDLLNLQPGPDLLLFSLSFLATNPGTAAFLFDPNPAAHNSNYDPANSIVGGDPALTALTPSQLVVTNPTTVDQATPIPEPSTFLYFGAALLAATLLRRRHI